MRKISKTRSRGATRDSGPSWARTRPSPPPARAALRRVRGRPVTTGGVGHLCDPLPMADAVPAGCPARGHGGRRRRGSPCRPDVSGLSDPCRGDPWPAGGFPSPVPLRLLHVLKDFLLLGAAQMQVIGGDGEDAFLAVEALAAVQTDEAPGVGLWVRVRVRVRFSSSMYSWPVSRSRSASVSPNFESALSRAGRFLDSRLEWPWATAQPGAHGSLKLASGAARPVRLPVP
jgi:hypothetical protein